MKACTRKHTKYQVPDEHWKCPKCGSGEGDFFVEFAVDDEDCEILHDDDDVICSQCDYSASGRSYSRLMSKGLHLVKCPHCKGSGYIEKKKE